MSRSYKKTPWCGDHKGTGKKRTAWKTVRQWLKDNPDILNELQNKLQYIMIDEYQDTNYAQYVLIKLLADKYKNLCVVGDDDQSIYKFRGATIENIIDFENKRYHIFR